MAQYCSDRTGLPVSATALGGPKHVHQRASLLGAIALALGGIVAIECRVIGTQRAVQT